MQHEAAASSATASGRRWRRLASGLALALTLATVPAPAAQPDRCFTPADRPEAGLRVYRAATPPVSDDQAGYANWPITAAVTFQIGTIARSHAEHIDFYGFLWANRCLQPKAGEEACSHNPKGNYLMPHYWQGQVEVRPFFSSLARANACTLAQAAHLLGETDDQVQQRAGEAGIDLVRRSDPLDARIQDGRFMDLCILSDDELPAKARGIMLDYEVQDGRTPAETLGILTEFSRLVRAHGKVPLLFTNPLDAPTQRWTGIHPTIAPALLDLFDKTSILLWHDNRQGSIAASFAAQMAVLKGPDGAHPVDPARLMVVFELANTTQADARTVHDLMHRAGIADLYFWRNLAEIGGRCDSDVNQKIACLALGRCQ